MKHDNRIQHTIVTRRKIQNHMIGFKAALTSVRYDNRRVKPILRIAEMLPKKRENDSGIFNEEKKIDKN